MKKIIIFLFLLSSIIIISCSNNKGPNEYDSFAQCLTEKGATMYGTAWCSHCKNQKNMFGNSFQYVNYVDCDISSKECIVAGVKSYPTWKIDGKNYPGEKSLQRLSILSECEL